MLLRKQRRLPQAALATLIGTSGDVLDRYEHPEVTPSIDVVAKLADALDVTIDYLAGKTALRLDGPLLRRVEDLEGLGDEDRRFVLRVVDMALRDAKDARYAA